MDTRDLDRYFEAETMLSDIEARVVWRGTRPYALLRVGARSVETALPSGLLLLDSETICTLLARAAHENAAKLREKTP